MNAKQVLIGLFMSAGLIASASAVNNVNVSIDAQVVPGVYGRINIGNGPAPVLVYPQPVLIYQPVRPVQVAPIYLNVPPGHAKNWRKHCQKYNACGQQVFFVRTAEYEPGYREHEDGKEKHEKYEKYEKQEKQEKQEKRNMGNGHGKGHDRD